MSDLSRELIVGVATEAVKVASLVHYLAGTYEEISQGHLMPMVGLLIQTFNSLSIHERLVLGFYARLAYCVG